MSFSSNPLENHHFSGSFRPFGTDRITGWNNPLENRGINWDYQPFSKLLGHPRMYVVWWAFKQRFPFFCKLWRSHLRKCCQELVTWWWKCSFLFLLVLVGRCFLTEIHGLESFQSEHLNKLSYFTWTGMGGWLCLDLFQKMSSVKNPGWLLYMKDYTTQFYRDYKKPWNEYPYEPTSISWNVSQGFASTAQIEIWRFPRLFLVDFQGGILKVFVGLFHQVDFPRFPLGSHEFLISQELCCNKKPWMLRWWKYTPW